MRMCRSRCGPLQQPHPPFWYGSSNEIGSTWAGEHGLHFVTLGPTAIAKANIDAYQDGAGETRRSGAAAVPEFSGGAAIGVQRHIFVADTDAEALRFGKPAMEVHLANLNWLRVKHRRYRPDLAAEYAAWRDFRGLVSADGTVIAGSPQTVRAEIERQVKELGINYLLTYLFLGTMSLADALRSLEPVQHRNHAASGEAVRLVTSRLRPPPACDRPAARRDAAWR